MTTAEVRATPTAVDRLREWQPTDRLLSWALTLGIAALAFVVRVVNVAQPQNKLIFDESYYAKDAWSLLKYGYEGTWPKEANAQILAGDLSGLQPAASFVVHPPLGKWLIAIGESAFGMNSFGWRIMAVVFGALLVGATIRLARRVSRSTMIGALAASCSPSTRWRSR